jgi:hypothetical protein
VATNGEPSPSLARRSAVVAQVIPESDLIDGMQLACQVIDVLFLTENFLEQRSRPVGSHFDPVHQLFGVYHFLNRLLAVVDRKAQLCLESNAQVLVDSLVSTNAPSL